MKYLNYFGIIISILLSIACVLLIIGICEEIFTNCACCLSDNCVFTKYIKEISLKIIAVLMIPSLIFFWYRTLISYKNK